MNDGSAVFRESLALVAPAVLANALEVSEGTLANWRAKKKGPAWVRVGRKVMYRQEAVREWLKRQES